MGVVNVTQGIVDLPASRIVQTSALTKVIVLRVRAFALQVSWVLIVQSRAAAAAMVHATTLGSVSASQVGQVETAPSC